MSTPSTATATTVHPHLAHYGHSHYQAYQPNTVVQSTGETALGGATRFGQSYASYPNIAANSNRNTTNLTRQPALSTSIASPQSTSSMVGGKAKRQPNWNEFYRNGVPEEIIVIDDTPPPTTRSSARMPNQNPQTEIRGGAQPAAKKRRTGQAQDTVQTSYDHLTPQYIHSNSNTTSLDRTTSIHTTAPTSLGSHGSIGTNGPSDAQATGQKRKRITRQTTSTIEKKRKEVENVLSSYVPPKQPPVKATDVPVRVIKEVGNAACSCLVDEC